MPILADLFTETKADIADQTDDLATAKQQRDDFIAAQFPLLNNAFSDMIDAVCGEHVNLSITRNTIIQTYSNRGFSSLNKLLIDVQSTLYGSIETLHFVPDLEVIEANQFGVIYVSVEGVKPSFSPGDNIMLFQSMLFRGIIMRGTEGAELSVKNGEQYTALTESLLYEFLAAIFVRGA